MISCSKESLLGLLHYSFSQSPLFLFRVLPSPLFPSTTSPSQNALLPPLVLLPSYGHLASYSNQIGSQSLKFIPYMIEFEVQVHE